MRGDQTCKEVNKNKDSIIIMWEKLERKPMLTDSQGHVRIGRVYNLCVQSSGLAILCGIKDLPWPQHVDTCWAKRNESAKKQES